MPLTGFRYHNVSRMGFHSIVVSYDLRRPGQDDKDLATDVTMYPGALTWTEMDRHHLDLTVTINQAVTSGPGSLQMRDRTGEALTVESPGREGYRNRFDQPMRQVLHITMIAWFHTVRSASVGERRAARVAG